LNIGSIDSRKTGDLVNNEAILINAVIKRRTEHIIEKHSPSFPRLFKESSIIVDSLYLSEIIPRIFTQDPGICLIQVCSIEYLRNLYCVGFPPPPPVPVPPVVHPAPTPTDPYSILVPLMVCV
jgi:hypothetical protein